MTFERLYNLLLSLLAGVFFFFPRISGLVIGIILLTVLYGTFKKEFQFKFSKTFLFPVLLYLAFIIGIIFTDHMNLALGYAENKLALLVFPLIFSFQPTFKLRVSHILIGSAIGLSIASLYGIYHSISCLQEGGLILNCITSVGISPIHHPTYFASFILIINFGIWWARKRNEPLMSLKWMIPFTVFMAVIFMLCLSLAAMLSVAILSVVLVLRWIRNKYGKTVFWISTILSPVVLIIFLFSFPVIKDDVKNTKRSITAYISDPIGYVEAKTGYKSGNEVRLIMWTVTTLEIMDHPFGVGTGNTDAVLSERLTRHGQVDLAKKSEDGTIKYNPHNQYLQTALELGIIGALLLILFLTSSIRMALRRKNAFLLVIPLSLMINTIFESMLQRQSGIVFYLFWICLMLLFVNAERNRNDVIAN